MYFLVIDDDLNFIRKIKEKIQKEFFNSSCDTFTSCPPQIILKDNYDVIIVDLMLGKDNGIEIAKKLKQKYPKASIVCISNTNELIFDTQILGTLCFIRKNAFDHDFNIMKQLITRCKGKNKNITIRLDNTNHIDSKDKVIKIDTEDIVYIVSYAHKVVIVTIHDNYTTNLTLKKIQGMLYDCECFVQIHRSHMINMNYIKLVNKDTVELMKVRHNNNILEIGRKYKTSFDVQFERFLLS